MNGISPPPFQLQRGVNALSAPTTPTNRLPIVDRAKANPEDVAAAQDMEAMFIDYMLKTMRETVPKGELDLENQGTSIYRGILDSEMAEKAAKAGGVGLSDQIIAYLQAQRYNNTVGVQPPSVNLQRQDGTVNKTSAESPAAVQSTGRYHESK